MPNVMVRIVGCVVLACAAEGLSGCLAAAAGVGAAYALGEETMYSDLDVAKTAEAVKQAFADYGVTYTGTEKKDDGVYVRGHKFIVDDKEEVTVGVWDKGKDKQTKIETRIGTIGKKKESLELMALIQKRLDAMGK